jgi:Concanavalin A-like lectin/glucanases superfamily
LGRQREKDVRMTANSVPRKGDVFLKFNGIDTYVEIPSTEDYSLATTGELTVTAWIRPDTLNFPRWEATRYVHWLGKGEGAGDNGQQEWTFRMYNRDHTADDPPRPNRISFYVFNPAGGEGVGSHFQDTLHKGHWIFVAGIADAARTYIYRDGEYRRCDTFRGPSLGRCPIHYQPPPNQDVQLQIDPTAGTSPLRLGTRDLNSFFEGGISRLRIWNRALEAHEVAGLYASDAVPAEGLIAEFLLNRDSGATAIDTAQGNDGTILGGLWAVQD